MLALACTGGRPSSPTASNGLDPMVTTAVPAGFREVGSDQPEEGAQSRADVAALLQRCDASCDSTLLGDFDAGYSRHFIRRAMTDDSLVIRVYRFHTVIGATHYTMVRGQPDFATTIPGYADARLTDELHPDRRPSSDCRTAPFQRLALGRICNVAITVFFRSASNAHTDNEALDLFHSEAALVASRHSC